MSDCRCHQQMSGELHPSPNMLSRSSESYTLSLFFLSSWASSLHQRDAAVSFFDKISSFIASPTDHLRRVTSQLTELISKQMAPLTALLGVADKWHEMYFHRWLYSQSILGKKSSRRGLVQMSSTKQRHLQSPCPDLMILFTRTPIK